jgi:hypothetical protein
MTGPQGVAGAIGPQGPVGPQGGVGPTGAQGSQGPPGALDAAQLQTLNTDNVLITADDPVVKSHTTFIANYGSNYLGVGTGVGCTSGDYLGQIILTPYTFAIGIPADGRLLPISQYQALFALIGTTYGGDGMSTFAVPDLRAITPAHMIYSICQTGIFPSRQ